VLDLTFLTGARGRRAPRWNETIGVDGGGAHFAGVVIPPRGRPLDQSAPGALERKPDRQEAAQTEGIGPPNLAFLRDARRTGRPWAAGGQPSRDTARGDGAQDIANEHRLRAARHPVRL
jgi:hypothetical protein